MNKKQVYFKFLHFVRYQQFVSSSLLFFCTQPYLRHSSDGQKSSLSLFVFFKYTWNDLGCRAILRSSSERVKSPRERTWLWVDRGVFSLHLHPSNYHKWARLQREIGNKVRERWATGEPLIHAASHRGNTARRLQTAAVINFVLRPLSFSPTLFQQLARIPADSAHLFAVCSPMCLKQRHFTRKVGIKHQAWVWILNWEARECMKASLRCLLPSDKEAQKMEGSF